jgi:hypothetical protein
LEGLGIAGNMILKWILREQDWRVRTGFRWLSIGAREKWWALVNTVITFLFHKMRGISWLCQDLLTSCEVVSYFLSFCLFVAQQPYVGLGLLIFEVPWSHSDTPQSVALLSTSDQSVAETSTWQPTTLTRDIHPCSRWDSNPWSQQVLGRRPTPYTAWPLVSAVACLIQHGKFKTCFKNFILVFE